MMVLLVDCLKIDGIAISRDQIGTPGKSWDLTSNPFQYHPIPSNTIQSLPIRPAKQALIMSIIMNCFSLFWCFPGDVIHLLQAWHGVYLGKEKTMIWRTAILAVRWSVWGERNSRRFRNLSNSAGTVASKAKLLIIEWVLNVKDLFGPDFFFLGV